MRITRAMLNKYAQETVNQRERTEPDLHAAYLVGSLLYAEPMLGGSTDIDVVLVHKYQASVERETQAITPEISLDLFHKTRNDYEQHRQFRRDPWMGYPLTFNHILLLDTDHWLEFIQASVSAEFHREDNVLARVNSLASAAREKWIDLIQNPSITHQEWLQHYLEILSLAANAIAGLIGPPLTTRRFLITLKDRCKVLDNPKILAGFYGLIGFSEPHEENFGNWIEALRLDWQHLQESTRPPAHLADCRRAYYLDAMQALHGSDDPRQAAWPLLHTWLEIQLAAEQPLPSEGAWQSCLETLQLSDSFTERKTEALDAFLDNMELAIESWSNRYGM
jgi:hypothetical protein